jgi:hypothetical protein
MLGIMTPLSKHVLAALLACLAANALAGPAPWFMWRSKTNGQQFCAQTSLGQGWEKSAGPFKDSHCTKLAPTQ